MRHRPFAVLGVVLLLVVGLLGTPVLGQPDETVTLQRVAAGDRIGTAVAVSQRFFPTADHVVLARADGFADALAGSPLAGLHDAPVLLTAPNALPTVVAEEITRLGATAATILGGEAAIGEAVADQLADAGLVVERLSGADRFATAAAVAGAGGAAAGGRVIVALGTHPDPDRAWPDALSAANLAVDGTPVLLTAPDLLPQATRDAITALAPSEIVIVGGELAVGPVVEAELASTGATVTRVAGDSRYTTALAAADEALDTSGTRQSTGVPRTVVFTTAEAYPDALASGALLPYLPAVLVLVPTETLDESVRQWLQERAGEFDEAWVIGGTAAVSETTFDAIQAALATDVPPDPTTEPTPTPTDGGEPIVPVSPGGPLPVPTPTDSGSPTPTETETPDPDPTETETPDPDPTPTETETPLPVIDAPPNPTTGRTIFADTIEFLYAGPDAVQTGLDTDAIDDDHVGVVAGRVLDRDGSPLPGVTVTVADRPDLGQTLTRADGHFDLVVPGGGTLVVTFDKDGLIGVERSAQVPWQDWVVLEDVVMIAFDTAVTTIDPDAGGAHTATPQVDDDGTRTTHLVFPPGLVATMTLPDGSTQVLDGFDVRATEFTVGPYGPQAMPAELPATSAYTYAAEFSLDEAVAAGAVGVTFDQPVATHVDNYLGFPVGFPVPAGYYDDQLHAWIGIDSGVIIEVLATDGGTATVDVDGDGNADDPVANGFTDTELAALAASYAPGDTVMRVLVDHFSRYDLNYADKPLVEFGDDPAEDEEPDDPCEQLNGSTIRCEARTIGETVALNGLGGDIGGLAISYVSDRQDGFLDGRSIEYEVTSDDVDPAIIEVQLEWTVAGQTVLQQFPNPAPNTVATFTWDGLDRYGREVVGEVPVSLRTAYIINIDYTNAVFPLPPLLDVEQNTGQFNVIDLPDQRVGVNERRTWQGTLTNGTADQLAGWSLPDHHYYSPVGSRLYYGDGSTRAIDGTEFPTATLLTGGEDSTSEGIPASQVDVEANDVVVAPSGAIHVAEGYRNRVRTIDTDYIVTTIAGTGTAGYTGDGGPATAAQLDNPGGMAVHPDGSLWIADTGNHVIRRVATDGTITTVAGTGTAGYTGDDGPATAAQLDGPTDLAVTSDGAVFVADTGNDRIRRIAADGTIVTYAGGGTRSIRDFTCEGGFVDDNDNGEQDAGEAYCYRGDIELVAPNSVDVSDDGATVAIGQPAAAYGQPGGYVEITSDGLARQYAASQYTEVEADHDVALGPGGRRYVANFVALDAFDDNSYFGVAGSFETQGFEGRSGPSGALAQIHAVDIAPDGTPVVVPGPPFFGDTPENHVNEVFVLGGGLQSLTTLPGSEGPLIGDEVNGVPVAWAVPDDTGDRIFGFAEDGRHLTTVDPRTGVVLTTFGYDADGWLSSRTDAHGNTVTIQRDTNGVPTGIVDAYGRLTSLTVTDGMITGITDPAGRTRTFGYDDGLLVEQVDAAGGTSTYTYDTLGRLTGAVAADGQVTTLTETTVREDDESGHEVTMTVGVDGGGDATTYRTVTRGSRVVHTITDPTGAITEVETSADGSTVETSVPSGLSRSVSYGPHPQLGGLVLVETERRTSNSASGGFTFSSSETEWEATLADPLDPLSLEAMTARVTNPDGTTTTRTFDATTMTETLTHDDGRVETRTFDALGRVTSHIEAAGATPTTYAYDARGRLVRVARGAHEEVHTYDDSGRLRTTTNGEGETVSWIFDDADRLVSWTSPEGRTTTYSWDDRDHRNGWGLPGTDAHELTLTPFGLLDSHTAPTAAVATDRRYDDRRQPTGVDYPDGSSSIITVIDGHHRGRTVDGATTAFTYHPGQAPGSGEAGLEADWATASWTPDVDAAGLPVTLSRFFTTDALSILTTQVDAVAHTYDYDSADGIVTSRQLDGEDALAFDVSAEGAVRQVGPWTWQSTTPNDPTNAITDGTSSVTLDVDGLSQVLGFGMTHDTAGDVVDIAFTRDNAGRITEQSITIDGTTTVERFSRDLDGQLVAVTDGADNPIESWTWDDHGNRTSTTAGGLTATATHDDRDRLLERDGITYTSDANGFVTAIGDVELDYLPTGELVEVSDAGGPIAEYGYDAMGRMTARVDAAGTRTIHLYGDPHDPLLVTGTITTPDGGAPVVTEYVHQQSTRFLAAVRHDGDWYTVVTDAVGSPRAVVDASGTVVLTRDYSPFGELRSSTGSFPLAVGFGGGLEDPDTGLVRMGLRDYDPAAGRWLSPDPLLIDSGEPNLYRYARNDPVTLHDPTGGGAVGGGFCLGGACLETEIACDSGGCSLCIGGGLGTPGGSVSIDPGQGQRGNEGYYQFGCSLGPFELGVECRVVQCGPNNPDMYKSKCEFKGPLINPWDSGVLDALDLDVGCSATAGVCFPL